MSLFTAKTFKYFDEANKNAKSETWFDENKDLYNEQVKDPFGELLNVLDARFADDLESISISPRNLSKPKRPKNKWADKGVNKDFAGFLLAQKRSSLFEWNPGIHFQLGSPRDDNHIGMGLYMVSSRQMKRLREALVNDFDSLEEIMADKRFISHWGEIVGERYKRLPAGLPEKHKALDYFFYKQFYISKSFTRTEVKKASFLGEVIDSIDAGLPLLRWIRRSVGVH